MSKRILSEVVVTLTFGLDAQALFDKPPALTSIKPLPAPKSGNPLSSPPPPPPLAHPTLFLLACNEDPYWQKAFLYISFH